jgi:hypothetical protein
MTSSFVPPQSRNWSSSDAEGGSEALNDEMDGVSTLKPTTLSSLAGGGPSGRTGAGAGARAGEGPGAASARPLRAVLLRRGAPPAPWRGGGR